jgi:hypothetical protein
VQGERFTDLLASLDSLRASQTGAPSDVPLPTPA